MGDPISVLYDKRVEDESLERRSKLMQEVDRENDKIKLNDFIKKKVHPKFQKRLLFLIDEYADNLVYSVDDRNERIYRTGFNDCLDLIFNLKST